MIQVSVEGVSYYELNIINVKAFGGLPVPSSCHASCHGGVAVYSNVVPSIGQPLLIGGSMGTSSYILVGEATSEAKAFLSVCHGVGLQRCLRSRGCCGTNWPCPKSGTPQACHLHQRVISVNLEQIGVILTELLLRLRDSARDLGPLPHGIVSHKLEDASCRGL